MSQDSTLSFVIPSEFNQEHHDALVAYLTDDRYLETAVWQQLFKGIDLLDKARVVTEDATRTFRQVYDELIGRPFANQYIERLLETDVDSSGLRILETTDSPKTITLRIRPVPSGPRAVRVTGVDERRSKD